MRIVPVVLSSLMALAFASALGGCQKDSEAEPPMTPATAPTPAAYDAAQALASTMCNREQRCNKIGPNADFASREHCMQVKGNEATKKVKNCRQGIDNEDLRECMAEISNQDCSGMFDSMERSIQCSMDDLCL